MPHPWAFNFLIKALFALFSAAAGEALTPWPLCLMDRHHQDPSSSPPWSCLWMPGKLLYFCLISKTNSHRRNTGLKLFYSMCPLSAESAFSLKTQCKPQSCLFKGLCDRKDSIWYSVCGPPAALFLPRPSARGANGPGRPFRCKGRLQLSTSTLQQHL